MKLLKITPEGKFSIVETMIENDTVSLTEEDLQFSKNGRMTF